MRLDHGYIEMVQDASLNARKLSLQSSVVLVPSFLGLLVLSLINTHNFVVA